jgi:spore maturation protein CgeB
MLDLTAMIVPMRMGGGVQTKILEAMAAKVPVICSSFANEGIAAPPNEVVLIANTPAECVDQAERLLQEPNFEAKLTSAGFDWVVAQHAPELFDRSITEICMQVLAARDLNRARPGTRSEDD